MSSHNQCLYLCIGRKKRKATVKKSSSNAKETGGDRSPGNGEETVGDPSLSSDAAVVTVFEPPFSAISILNPNYDVINDVISGFAKVVVERCGFHHWIAQRISWGEVVSVFLYLL